MRSMLFRWLWRRMQYNRAPQRRFGYARPQPNPYAWRRQPQQRRRGGFWGPFPYWSTRTRGGSRVTVSGCCLPLALSLVAAPLLALRVALRR